MVRILNSAQSLSEQEVSSMERKWGRQIPLSYREFLLQFNGGYPDPSDFKIHLPFARREGSVSVDWFLGINVPESTLNIDYVLDAFRGRLPSSMFPVARDPGGNLICICDEPPDLGKLFLWDHEREADEGEAISNGNLYPIACGFGEFLQMLA